MLSTDNSVKLTRLARPTQRIHRRSGRLRKSLIKSFTASCNSYSKVGSFIWVPVWSKVLILSSRCTGNLLCNSLRWMLFQLGTDACQYCVQSRSASERRHPEYPPHWKQKKTLSYNREQVLPQLSETVYSAAFTRIVTNLISSWETTFLLLRTNNADSGRHSAEFSFSIVSQSDLSKKKTKTTGSPWIADICIKLTQRSAIFVLTKRRAGSGDEIITNHPHSTLPSLVQFKMYTGRRNSICRQGVQLKAEAAVFVSDVAKQQDVYSLRHPHVKIFMAVLSTRATFLLVTKCLNV